MNTTLVLLLCCFGVTTCSVVVIIHTVTVVKLSRSMRWLRRRVFELEMKR